eukprot:CAMPEP_0197000856 /NCGR_PEP_ID=MMETSP1380-20130617/5697_1 /TAXON_ID=5936 /ORGANISM="Euplotes crassus, Strain CT5" /LENGTH=532 /DNA_ID=CAMNT_0042418309 /DNA_START=9 /DNA_END=1607 /DNA_ORIENTATION=-
MADMTSSRRKQPKGDMSMSILQKRFKIDDGKNKYVEQSTLLEPSNKVTHKQDEEEMKEVSASLAELKKNHDIIKKRVNEKEKDLDTIRKEIQQLEYQESTAEGAVYENDTRKEQIENAVSVTQKKTAEELMNSRVHAHMIERLNKDLIAMEIYKKNLETSLKNKETMFEEQKEKFRAAKEQKLQSKTIFDNLVKNLYNERNEKKKRIEQLVKSMKNKTDNVRRRVERIKRQNELAEAAANENKDADEKQMRREFMFNKLWNSFIRKKMQKEMKESTHIDEAFKAIKTATGVTDVQKLVEKFLTREQTYSELLVAVADSESRIDKLRRENEVLRSRLNELKIGAEEVEGGHSESEEIVALKKELDEVQREEAIMKEKYYNVEIVQDLIDNWARKIIGKVDDEATEDRVNNMDLVEIFQKLSGIVVQNLEDYENDDEDEMIPASNMMNDHLTQDFMERNIRIRPSSGKTEADIEKSKYGSKNGPQTDNLDDNAEKQYNDDLIELDNQRKNIKDKILRIQEENARKRKLEKGDEK